jgi:hypothetical protein
MSTSLPTSIPSIEFAPLFHEAPPARDLADRAIVEAATLGNDHPVRGIQGMEALRRPRAGRIAGGALE